MAPHQAVGGTGHGSDSEISLRFLPPFMTHVQQIGRKKWIEYFRRNCGAKGLSPSG